MRLLDSQISRALVQPTPWEVSQYRKAALRDKAAWSALIDIGSSHRFCDDVQRSVDTEIRREREILRCGGSPGTVAQSASVPTELARNEYYQARVLYGWYRPDSRTEASSKVTQFVDKVATVAQGAVAPNARSIDANHAWAQASGPAQVAAIGTSALFNNREAAVYTGAQRYISTLPSGTSWDFLSSGAGGMYGIVAASTDQTVVGRLVSAAGTGGVGIDIILNAVGTTGDIRSRGFATAGAFIFNNLKTNGALANVPFYLLQQYSEADVPEQVSLLNRVTMGSGASLNAPAATVAGRLSIGGDVSAGLDTKSIVVDAMFAKTTSSVVKTAWDRYVTIRYAGIV